MKQNMKKYAFTDGDLIRHVIEGENKEDAVLRFCGWNRTRANYILKNYKIVRVYG